ncbi:SIR2 family protein, partial [candidate division WOR-3 bacterium]|nr:SIR2 family protein [candidate division WOR-3 bacterium]
MNIDKDFPGQTYIEKIREHLWRGREFGKAAVMIGSGFSRNAKKLSPKTPKFPLWKDLADIIYDKLYPNSSSSNQTLKDPIKLATEYNAVHSQQSLNSLILKSIPDKKYIPGELHRLLLYLPWSDIFTTNYDTLLERTRPYIHDRKYDLVLTPEDIANSMKPRIVKLHGSFPSNRPFIITEEDYRTYPEKFAPFVNLIQESIMENAFCLIGFSGDDPNFLNWTGWIRDNLGESAPPIYLIGILDLTLPQRQVLNNRNVYPIDLSPLFPESTWPGLDLRCAKALEWFLVNLMYGQPPNKITWPTPISSKKIIWNSSESLPPIPLSPLPLSNLGDMHPGAEPLQKEDLESLLETWCQKRIEYPGWA